MLVPAVFAVLMKINLNLWERIIEKSLERGYPNGVYLQLADVSGFRQAAETPAAS